MRRYATMAALYVVVLVIAAVTVQGFTATSPESEVLNPEDLELTAALEPFDGCDALLDYFRREGMARVGPYGLDGEMVTLEAMEGTEGGGAPVRAEAAGDQAAAGGTGGGDGPSYSTTNVQEAGVDEPDVVKTDGARVVALARDRLHVLGVSGSQLRRLGSLRIPEGWGSELLLDGDRVLVVGQGTGGGGLPMPVEDGAASSPRMLPHPGGGGTTFRLVDISDPFAPELVSTLVMDGSYLSARLVEGVARVVVTSRPVALPFEMPEGGGLRAEREATRRNREIIAESTIDQWLPYSILTDETAGRSTEQPLLDCTAVSHPSQFAGFGMLSVLSIDLADDLRTEGATGVVGAAETVYASTDNLYVALNRWGEPGDAPGDLRMPAGGATTEIHSFDISEPAAARYVASGAVRGRLLNQWALSEHDGHIRVATTTGEGAGAASESAVTVLRPDGGRLRRVGQVGGLGRTEQIYAVRFEGPIAYVVTFRQTDPLYTLDLSDPRRPEMLGELKIDGYSAYLHPVGEGRVLGVGQDATKQGQITGSQVSLFDVSDLVEPRRLDQLDLGPGSSPVEYDHRALLFWPPSGTAVIPLQTWERNPFSGAVVLRVTRDGLREQGRIRHPAGGGPQAAERYWGPEGPVITRSLVVDDFLLTVSDAGVLLSDLGGLQRRDWVRF